MKHLKDIKLAENVDEAFELVAPKVAKVQERNALYKMAREMGVDYDEDTKDEFNRFKE